MKFAISSEYLLYRMIQLHKNLASLSANDFDKELKTIDSIYKKLDYIAQGEYHHFWCEYIKG
jgi:hypothetical protein